MSSTPPVQAQPPLPPPPPEPQAGPEGPPPPQEGAPGAGPPGAGPPMDPPEAPRRRSRKSRERRSGTYSADGSINLFDLSGAGPRRDELDRMAAAELGEAIAPSLDLLQMSVPGASSPDEAAREIEGQLGPPVRDPDADIPTHPRYKGDALVYYQLRRHYGRPNPGGSFQRSWYPGGGPGGGGLPPMLGS